MNIEKEYPDINNINYPVFVPLFYYDSLIGTMIINANNSRFIEYTGQYSYNKQLNKWEPINDTPERMKLSALDEAVLKLLPLGYDKNNRMTRPKMLYRLQHTNGLQQVKSLSRKADDSIRRLFNVHRVPIATTRKNGGGRWLALTYPEIDESLKASDAQAHTMLENNAKRRAWFKNILTNSKNGQSSLTDEDSPKHKNDKHNKHKQQN